jgi:uncharacterized protein YuzE
MAQINNINTFYDKDVDILYISFGNPKKAICHELEDGELIRLDPFTDEIVGITIMDLEERYHKSFKKIESKMNDIVKSIIERYKHEIAI